MAATTAYHKIDQRGVGMSDYDMRLNETDGSAKIDTGGAPGDVPVLEVREVVLRYNEHPAPTDRSFWESGEYETPHKYFTSTEPLQKMRCEHDWSVAKRNLRMLYLALFTMVVMIVEQEVVFDRETRLFRVQTLVPSVFKGVISALTALQLYLLYDYYQYLIAGHKKEWYTALYVNRPAPPGMGEIPRGLMGTKLFCSAFIAEFIVLILHAPPGLDFRFWCCRSDEGNEHIKKPFLSDKFNLIVFARIYLLVRVLRDACPLWRRRFQIYAGGYARRGGPEINFAGTMRYYYCAGKIGFTATILCTGMVFFGYCLMVCERDYDIDMWSPVHSLWYVLFNMLLCGYGGMFPVSAYGQYVLLLVLIFGLVILSLAIEVIFGLMALDEHEQQAVDWIGEYQGRELETTAATAYLAYWWRYAAFAGDTPEKHQLSSEEFQDKKTDLYRNAVMHFNEMRKQSALLTNLESMAEDSAAEDLTQATEDLAVVHEVLSGQTGGAINPQLESQLAAIEERQQAILATLDA
jgi:hypothetical protein